MKADLSNWTKNWSLAERLFSPTEVSALKGALSGFRPRHVFYCSFESRFARSGGLAAVAMNTLPFLKETGRFDSVSLMSPFYPKLMDGTRFSETSAVFEVPFGNHSVRAELLRFDLSYSKPRQGSLSEYYLKADGFFEADNVLKDPYLYREDDPAANEKALRENSLFYCRAVPMALVALGATADVVLHLQEWQTALLSLTAKDAMAAGALQSCGTVQTMHNSFDSFFSKADLQKVVTGAERQRRVAGLRGDGATAFWVGLQLVDAPVVTVSEHYAEELVGEILQTEHFAPHLQGVFREHPVVGINNGPFVDFSESFPNREKHTLDEIRIIKSEVRHALLNILDTYNPPGRFGELTYRGGSILGLPDDIPILVMSGRLDPVQKGYDILLQALERFAADEIKAVLTPMALRASDLDFFHEVAGRCRGNLTVFPMRMQQGYRELQTGSTFGVMPSIYEPFGAAIEYMVNGTVNVVRRTGGLVDQVVHRENGFAFREKPESCTLERTRQFVAAANHVEVRKTNPWALSMITELYLTLRDATATYRKSRDTYYAMILRGFAKAATFSWEKNASEYSLIYEKIALV